MIPNEHGIEWDNIRNDIVRELFDLMDRGLLVWEPVFGHAGCRYIATYNGHTFQLNCCDTENQYLLMNGKVMGLGKYALKALCDKVSRQQGEQYLQEHVANLKEFRQIIQHKPSVAI